MSFRFSYEMLVFSLGEPYFYLLPKFGAKIDNLCYGLPRFFSIKNLEDLVGPEEEATLCMHFRLTWLWLMKLLVHIHFFIF